MKLANNNALRERGLTRGFEVVNIRSGSMITDVMSLVIFDFLGFWIFIYATIDSKNFWKGKNQLNPAANSKWTAPSLLP